jgi:hypothetical protein
VPDNYPDDLLLGVGDNSCGYHSDGKYVSTTVLSKYVLFCSVFKLLMFVWLKKNSSMNIYIIKFGKKGNNNKKKK